MSNNKPDFNTAFQALRLSYEAALPERAEKMQQFCDQYSPEQAQLLIQEAHKLAGASGTFGHPELGTLAKSIELLARELKQKPWPEQLQALPLLRSEISTFIATVKHSLQPAEQATTTAAEITQPKNSVWLVHDDQNFIAELTSQLEAFDHQVCIFSDFQLCLAQMQHELPAVLFVAVTVAGTEFFQQQSLVAEITKHQIPLVLYAEQDGFDLRINAAQLRALAFFVSPLDMPNIISTLTEVIEQQTKSAGRVAIIEDDKLLAEHYALVLEAAGIRCYQVQNVSQMVDELIRFQPDLLLMDLYMPDYSGPELAGVLRQYRTFKRLPIIFLSSEHNKTLQLQALSHGADDFLTKPIDDLVLVQSIKIRLARALEIRGLIEKDSLTHLIKHSAIKEVASLEFERACRFDKPLSVVMLDIDNFKRVNDNYGHAIGDIVIATLATLLRKRIRKTDRAGRYGGEEFLLVLPDCTGLKAVELVENMLAIFNNFHFSAGDKQFTCSFSAGVASTSDNSFVDVDALIEAADKALYTAKRAGRNRVM